MLMNKVYIIISLQCRAFISDNLLLIQNKANDSLKDMENFQGTFIYHVNQLILFRYFLKIVVLQ